MGLWLYAHHVPLELGGVSLGLVPLGLLLVPGLLTYAGGRQVARVVRPQSLADVTRAVIPYALVYGVLAAVAAGVVRLRCRAAGSAHRLRRRDRHRRCWAAAWACSAPPTSCTRRSRRCPARCGTSARPPTAGLATVVLVSAVLTMLALGHRLPRCRRDVPPARRGLGRWPDPRPAHDGVRAQPDPVGWLPSPIGLGFPLGPDGVVSPQSIDYGALPVFPPLAALPPQGDPGPWAFVALAAPLLGGYAIAVVLHRRQRHLPVEHLAARAAAAGALAGAALGLLCWLSAGSVGDEALASLGPVGWQVGLVAALGDGAGGIGGGLGAAPSGRDHASAADRPPRPRVALVLTATFADRAGQDGAASQVARSE